MTATGGGSTCKRALPMPARCAQGLLDPWLAISKYQASPTLAIVQADASAEPGGGVAGDGEAQSATFSRRVNAMERVESPRTLRRRKAVAVVNYLEDGLTGLVRRAQGHRAARGHVSQRIVERVAQDHAQHLRIRPEDDLGPDIHPEVDPALIRQWNVFRDELAKETLDV